MKKEEEQKILGEYQLKQQLGNGTFGTVYKASKVQDEGKAEELKYYAIKVQRSHQKSQQNITSFKPLLHLQSSMLKRLHQKCPNQLFNNKAFSVPQVYDYSQEEYFSYMVIDLLDSTLDDFANKQMKNTLSKDCLIRIFYSLLKIVENLHQLGYTHRDIKPANFMLKAIKCKHKSIQQSFIKASSRYEPTIYPIDLGLCKSYINPITKQHIPFKQHKKMVGTPIFCSLNTHQGYEQSRRDDIQSIIYLIVYLVKKLPWESVSSKQIGRVEQKEEQNAMESSRKLRADIKKKLDSYEQMYKIKQSTDFDVLLKDHQLLPSCLVEIYKYVKKLVFQQQPNYEFISTLLEKQHLTLTGKKFSQINYQCRWENLCMKDTEKVQNVEQTVEKKKKIKINFKIPSNKLKKQNQIG